MANPPATAEPTPATTRPSLGGRGPVWTLLGAWLSLDFFGESRRTGQPGSTLTTTVFTQSFLAFVFAAFLFPDTPAVAFVAANLSLTTLLIALSTLADPEHSSREQADALLLGTAPIARWRVALARVLHGGFHVALTSFGAAIPGAVLTTWLLPRWWTPVVYLVLAVTLAGIARGSLGLVVRTVQRWAGAGAAMVTAGTLRAMLLGFGFVGFALCMRHLEGSAADLPGGETAAWLWPPYHAARIVVSSAVGDAGSASTSFAILGGIALVLWLWSLALPNAQTAARGRRVRSSILMRLLSRFAPHGPLRGIGAFTATMLWRSPGYRARVLPLFGLPAAMIFLVLRGDDSGAADGTHPFLGVAMQFPAIYMPFLVAFLPRADDPETGWLFRTAPALSITTIRNGALLALALFVLLPLFVVALVLLLATSAVPWPAAIGLVWLAWGTSVCATVVALRRLVQVPFTTADSGDAPLDMGTLMAGALVFGTAGGAAAGALSPMVQLGLGLFVATLAWIWLARARQANPTAGPSVEDAERAIAQARGSDSPATITHDASDPTKANHQDAEAEQLPPRPVAPESLRRELLALLVLDGALLVLPLLVGWTFGPN